MRSHRAASAHQYSMGRQLDKGPMLISMIEFEKGPVMLAPIGEDAFLVIVADKDANLGMIRLKLKKHSHELALPQQYNTIEGHEI